MAMAESTWQSLETLQLVMSHRYLPCLWALTVSTLLHSIMNSLRTQVLVVSVIQRHLTQATTKAMLGAPVALLTWQVIAKIHLHFDQVFQILSLELHRINCKWEARTCKAEGRIEHTVQDSQLIRCRYRQIRVLWQFQWRSIFNKLRNRRTKNGNATLVHQLGFVSAGRRRSKQLLHT